MKTLYLVRHAKSSWDDPFQDDFDRPLNKRGKTDAPRMGKRMKERNIQPDALISSPAERALATCMIMAEKMHYPVTQVRIDRHLYHATDDQLLALVQKFSDAHDTVMMFSHNPGLTEFLNKLSNEPVTENIPTCGVVAVNLPVHSWKDVGWKKGEVDFFDFPKNR